MDIICGVCGKKLIFIRGKHISYDSIVCWNCYQKLDVKEEEYADKNIRI